MIHIHPFAAIHPRPELAERVSELPYDVMDRQEAAAMAAEEPYSILHITRAEIDCPDNTGDYDDSVYARAKSNLQRFLADGVLCREEEPAYYIYRETMEGRVQTGLVATVEVRDYLENRVKKHELTRKDKELDRIRHFRELQCQTEPVFFAFEGGPEIIEALAQHCQQQAPRYDFIANDGVRHQLWCVDEPEKLSFLTAQFAALPSLYIADGHHRTASAAAVGEGRDDSVMMAVIFPAAELTIMAYNRVVKNLNGHTPQKLLELLAENFEIEPDCPLTEISKKRQFLMILNGRRFLLKAKPALYGKGDIVADLDAAVLQNNVLGPLLGIDDPRTDQNIDFIGGIRGYREVAARSEGGVGFILCPVTMEEIMRISDSGAIMFPKSTWFEPKLRSGLFLCDL